MRINARKMKINAIIKIRRLYVEGQGMEQCGKIKPFPVSDRKRQNYDRYNLVNSNTSK